MYLLYIWSTCDFLSYVWCSSKFQSTYWCMICGMNLKIERVVFWWLIVFSLFACEYDGLQVLFLD
jgi:hypothetical protein